MQHGKLSFSMFGRFLSINPPEPELLFDVKREHKANSDYSESGYPYIPNYGSAGGGAAYACSASNLKSPELYYNPWRFHAERGVEYTQLATGVFHITKLGVKENFQQADIGVKISSFKGFGSKMGIFISSDKPFTPGNLPYVLINDTSGGHTQGWQALNAGMNVWDLTDYPVNSNPEETARGAYLSFPSSWWDLEEDGTPAITPCDIYLVFFPVLDESQCNGYGEYLIPKFNNALWRKDSDTIVISDNGLTVDTTQSEHFWDLRIAPEAYYKDDYIAVYSPEFFNISCDQNINIIAEFRGVTWDGSGGESSETIGTAQVIGRTTGTNVPFYGGVAFKNSYNAVYLQFYFSKVGVFTMLPYNNDRFTVAYSGNNTNRATIQVSETVPFHDKCELQTLITKYRNTYKGSSILYRNEVLTTNEDLLGIYGFRLSTYAEDKTQYSHRHCILDAAQGRWENLVSYCNNTIVTNQITDYELLYKDTVSAVVLLNKEITSEDCTDTGSMLFSCRDRINNFSGQFYYLMGFKERLTPWQIAWALSHLV